MTKLEIRDDVLKELEEYNGLHAYDIIEQPGYFLFKFGLGEALTVFFEVVIEDFELEDLG